MLALFALTLANDGWWHSSGGEEPFAKEHGSIQMVREHLHIDVRDVDAKVRVEFTFKNHGEATTVEMGFPEQTYKGGDIDDLTSTVDGKPATVKRRLVSKDEDEYEYNYIWVKSVRFAKGQTRTIVNSYTQGLGGNSSGARYFGYTFATGASWFKEIEEIRVTYTYDPKSGNSYPFARKWSGKSGVAVPTSVIGRFARKIVWRNVEPDFSLNLEMTSGFWKVEVNGLLVPPDAVSYLPHGAPSDLEISLSDVQRVLCREQELSITNDAVFRDGIRVPLKRPVRKVPLWPKGGGKPTHDYVYLRDVVEALGGTYRYDPKFDKVYITVPTK
ncbi:MAG: hypothetical protein WD716_02920 [Fimbriimonadaceae bacterium]